MYLIALSMVGCLAVAIGLQTGRTEGLLQWPRWLALLGFQAIALVVVIELWRAAQFQQGHAVSMVDGWHLLLVHAMGGVASLIAFARFVWDERGVVHPSTVRIGTGVVGSGMAAYLLFVAVDHALFYHSDRAHSGTVSTRWLRELDPDLELDCSDATLLVARTNADAVQWRCPTGWVVGGLTATPIAPWPEYKSGESARLGQVLRRGLRDAR